MNHPLTPFDAVVICSYGGPDKPEDVLPFMRNATGGRGIPDERLMEVSQHYMMFGGRSPINDHNEALRAAIETRLADRGVAVPVVVGNRNWLPYLRDVVAELRSRGHRRILALATAAYHSYSSCRQYDEDIAGALDGLDDVSIERIDAYGETDAFVEVNTDAVREAVLKLREQCNPETSRLLFVTHSIPTVMEDASGLGTDETRYPTQHQRICERIVAALEPEVGALEWELTYCSRSGSPHTPWLEPDVNDRMEELAEEGVSGVVAAPIGFISDHMEVLYDLDTEARASAEKLGLAYQRAGTVGTDARFVAMLADELLAHAAVVRGEEDRRTTLRLHPDGTRRTCCLPRPLAKESA